MQDVIQLNMWFITIYNYISHVYCNLCLIYYVKCHIYFKLIPYLIPFTSLFMTIYYEFIDYHVLHCHLLQFMTNHLNGNKWIFITIYYLLQLVDVASTFSLVVPFSHESELSEHTKLLTPLINSDYQLSVCSFYLQSLPREGPNKFRCDPLTPIRRVPVVSLCALLCLFNPPNSFMKPSPWFSVCNSSHANLSGPFVFECSLCRQHGPSSILPSCALLVHFHPHYSFAKRLRPHQS